MRACLSPHMCGLTERCMLADWRCRPSPIGSACQGMCRQERTKRHVRRLVGPPLAEHSERLPERALGVLLVERVVDVGHVQRVHQRGEALHLAEPRLERFREWNLQLVQDAQRLHAHHHDHPGRHDRDLLDHPRHAGRVRQRGVRQRALHAQRPVHRQRIDRQALERLHQRAAGAAVEGDALLDLRGQRRVLEQHDVRLGVPGAEHRHQLSARAVGAGLQLARERAQLADCALQVLLADLVVGGGHGRGQI
jgi:hypothetical protein